MADNLFDSLSPEQKAMFAKMFAGQFQEIQQANDAFDPRNGKGEETDAFISEMLKSMSGESGGMTYDKFISENVELKNVVDTLISNPILIPYVSTWMTEKRETLAKQIQEMVKSMFPTSQPTDPKNP